tara:strand:+ start:51 stop:314 length:264 start_codon:yes stop_codon:yes gene_type:complete
MKTPQIEHGVLDPNTGAEITTPLGIPDYWVGKRVQIPAWSDRWMMGDRCGVVIARFRPWHYEDIYKVKLDVSGKTVSFNTDDLNVID